MIYEIKHRRSGRVIATQESDSLRDAVELLVRSGAILTGADLRDAVLTGANLRGAVTLAGDAGKALEWALGPATAGAFITMASCPWLEKVPNFYCDNATAMADIESCAAKERELQAAALSEIAETSRAESISR